MTAALQPDEKQVKPLNHFDDVWDRLGGFGLYQFYIYMAVGAAGGLTACHMLAAVFILPTAIHRCELKNYTGDSYAISSDYHAHLINISIPCSKDEDAAKPDGWDGCGLDKCHIYNHTEANSSKHGCSRQVYDHRVFEYTATEQFGLICQDESLRSLAQSIFMGGILVGALFLGQLSDLVGRKTILLASFALEIVTAVIAIFAQEFWQFALIRFLVGIGAAGMIGTKNVFIMECVSADWRPRMGCYVGFQWVFFAWFLTMSAYLERNWRYLNLIISVPFVALLIFCAIFVPESPRWLVNKGKHKEAYEVLKRYARWNKKPEISLEELENLKAETVKRASLIEIFKSKTLAIRSAIVFYAWFTVSLVYYGLTLNSGNLGSNIFLSFFLNTLVEIPAYFFTPVLVRVVGRKLTMVAMLIISGCFCISTIFIVLYGGNPKHSDKWMWILTGLMLGGKVLVSGAFQINYIYTSELFPTTLRTACVGAGSMFARVGGIVSPYIADLAIYFDTDLKDTLPQVVFGGVSILSGLLFLLLPETKDLDKLPETIKESKTFFRKSSEGKDTKDIKLDLLE